MRTGFYIEFEMRPPHNKRKRLHVLRVSETCGGLKNHDLHHPLSAGAPPASRAALVEIKAEERRERRLDLPAGRVDYRVIHIIIILNVDIEERRESRPMQKTQRERVSCGHNALS